MSANATSPPVREAIVIAGPGDAQAVVARVPLLVRTVLTLQRAGIERCTVVGAAPPVDPRIRVPLVAAPALSPPGDAALRLVVGPGAVIDGRLVRDLAARARPGQLLEVAQGGARVRVAPGPQVAIDGGGAEPPRSGVLALRTASRGVLEAALIGGLENPRDGYWDANVTRRFSPLVTRLFLRTPFSPNAVTVLGIAVGVAGGLLLGSLSPAGVVLGVVLLFVTALLDSADGELARVRFAESRLGHVLDVTGDTLAGAAVLAGIVLHLTRTGTAPGRVVLVLLALGVLGAFAAMTWSEVTEARRHRVDAWENRVLDRVLSPLSTRDWQVFVVAFALAGRLDALVIGGAYGAHGFWIAVVILVARVLRRAPA